MISISVLNCLLPLTPLDTTPTWLTNFPIKLSVREDDVFAYATGRASSGVTGEKVNTGRTSISVDKPRFGVIVGLSENAFKLTITLGPSGTGGEKGSLVAIRVLIGRRSRHSIRGRVSRYVSGLVVYLKVELSVGKPVERVGVVLVLILLDTLSTRGDPALLTSVTRSF